LVLAGCSSPREQVVLRGATMGTTYSVQLVDPPQTVEPAVLQEQVDDVLADINAVMSTYDAGSELSRFNASSSTDWYGVSAELAGVVAVAQGVSAASGGAFDVTVGPLVNLWGFGPGDGSRVPPDPERVRAAKLRTGYGKLDVRRSPPALRKAVPDLYVDLSAIAKGYGVDRVAALLDTAGVEDYLVEIGGELLARGRNARGEPWRIAVERPDPSGRTVQQVVALTDAALATSGDYRNFFEAGGTRYSHTIDPATGRPVTHDLASVTVLGADAMHADAHATALLVMGVDRGLRFARAAELAALFISRTGTGFETRATLAWRRASESATD
jgi:thiamine biosynthesis lipoprotein